MEGEKGPFELFLILLRKKEILEFSSKKSRHRRWKG